MIVSGEQGLIQSITVPLRVVEWMQNWGKRCYGFIMTHCIACFPLTQVRNFMSKYSYLGMANKFTIQVICFTTCWSENPPSSKKTVLWAELHFHQCLCRSRLALTEVKAVTSAGLSGQTCHQEVRSPDPAAGHSWTPACPAPGHPEGFSQRHLAPGVWDTYGSTTDSYSYDIS